MSKHKKMRFPKRWMKMKLIETINLTTGKPSIWEILKNLDVSDPPIYPWLDNNVVSYLTNEYYWVRSSDKTISKQFERIIKYFIDKYQYDEETAITTALERLARIILNKFANKWNRLYDAINIDYSPLENYDMTQTETPDITKEKTVATNVTTETKDDVTETAINGFNSTNPVPQGKTTRNGSSTVSGNADDNVETETETGTRGLTRHGNIGVTTSQQMLSAEIDIRRNFNFFNEIMDDVDSILCLLVY